MLSVALAVAGVWSVPAAARACSVCFSAAADNPEAAGLGWSVALLLVPVLAIQAVLAWFFVRTVRRARRTDPTEARP